MLSYLAGDLYDMTGWRQRRGPLPDQPEGNQAEIRRFPRGRKARPKAAPPPAMNWGSAAKSLGEIEPYVPPPDPPELYDQKHVDALHDAGFEPMGHAVWHRETENGSHSIFYTPGKREEENNKLVPWHLYSDIDETGSSHPTLKAAIRQADKESKGMSRESSAFPDWTMIS